MSTPIQIGASPLAPEQLAALNHVLACMTPAQAAWVGGYLTAACAGGVPPGAAAATGAAAPAAASESITVLVGSQTGNAEGVAEEVVAKASELGLAAKAVSMADFKPARLAKEKNLLVIVSTHGEGDPPDDAEDLHGFIHGKKAPKLEGARFSVLGLGDTSYEHFCQTGKDFDAQLEKLGAERLSPRVDCDVDYDDAAAAWMQDALAAFKEHLGDNGAAAALAPALGGAVAASPAPPCEFDRKNPFSAPVTDVFILNGRGSSKQTLHVELSLEDSGITYEPGDSLGVFPRNRPEMVEAILAATKADGGAQVEDAPLGDWLSSRLDITSLSRPVIEKYQAAAGVKGVGAILDPKNKQVLHNYLDGREIIDLLTDFPNDGLTPEQVVGLFRKLPARLYSIASSLEAHPDEVHLCVAVTRYRTHGRERHGVCSTWLADFVGEDDRIPVYVDRNKHFRLPADPATPIIMIGPGTGVAPFRAFVQQREATGASGKNWLLFGDRNFTTDFLYQTEWQKYHKSGLLTHLDVAFSRDQEEKLYVQHRLLQHSARVHEWIRDGAVVYVCGDADQMAPDVHDALLKIIQVEGGRSAEQAAEDLKALQKEKRYQRDVY